ncbi:lysylphosphatidylglycerol synthase transmembrane domain-containing protein [Serpentinicella alkaliphila]|uniref:Phosphatidylglycerol lysyltransferase n=1 Tax=Serpentinicella alkaliphila TaxID=1734049 RepID=A0A4R2TSH0_9FIRM|nr:lysylphosphatidylglycerol synthase transmembrane domain-containing protein [Serpentinicella alkaliphila]QUH25056.1 flippase-like domain-containing protein [Serpentinicella alkaliphila]TCQ00499.1 uncharacterized protein (TIRG00374 family) [Serpentinicella alkaliphila]
MEQKNIDFKRLKKSMFISVIIAMLLFAGLSIYSDINQLRRVFVTFNYRYIPIILLLAPLNYLLRFVKWSYYLKLIGVNITIKDNFLIFISGLSMTITPGKIGEFFKSYLLKEKANLPISSSAPLVMVERITDGFSMLILASLGILSYKHGLEVFLFVLVCMVAFIVIIQFSSIVYFFLDLLHRIPILKRFKSDFENFYRHAHMLLKPKPLSYAISIGVVSWFFEGLVIYFTIKAMGLTFTLLASIFVVSFSSIVGAISMMPGGLLAAEGSILGLLIMMDLPRDVAVATTLITRFSTLWLGVLIGFIGLIILQRSFDNKN